ncbi:MAG: glycosyltransferase family 4 protein [Chloroflexi bacterium]|nr:glycosyltransferase family 4 protein [Chloroflexota bacterium]
MKIALLHYSAPPTVGGVESVMAQHAKLMASAGHEVFVIAGTGEVFDRRIRFLSLPLISSRHTAVLDVKAELDKGIVPTGFAGLVKEIKSRLIPLLHSVDWLIAHNVCSLHKNLALTAALYELSQTPGFPKLILWHHDLAWTSARYEGELYPGYPWDLLRISWPGVKQVTISDMRRQEIAGLQKIQPEHIEVISNGLDVAGMLKLGSVARDLVERLDLLAAAPLLLLPVRITRRKNIELALQALWELRKRMTAAKLVITGPLGAHNPANLDYFQELRKIRKELNLTGSAYFLAEQVEGLLPDEVIFDLYRAADALFLPSHEEGFGIPILEAGLAGIPVFSSDIPTLRALGGSEVFYFLTHAEPSRVAAQIAEVLEANASYRLRIRVRQNYTWQAIYSKQIAPLMEPGNDLRTQI